jgi:hypothetical protein
MDGNIAARHPDIAKDAARDSFFQLFGVSGCEDMCMEFSKDGKHGSITSADGMRRFYESWKRL